MSIQKNFHLIIKLFVRWYLYRDRDRNSFISPWASSQAPLGSSNFDGPNFNQFGNNGLGMGGFNSFNSPNNANSSNNMMNGFNGIGNNPNMGGNSGFDNSLGGNNGPVFGMNNNLSGNNNMGNNLPNNIGNNGQNDEGRETTQVTIPKDVGFTFHCLHTHYLLRSNQMNSFQPNIVLFCDCYFIVGRCYYWQSWNAYKANSYGIKCIHHD